jgi:hypothetical protein
VESSYAWKKRCSGEVEVGQSFLRLDGKCQDFFQSHDSGVAAKQDF